MTRDDGQRQSPRPQPREHPVLISDARLATLRSRIERKIEPTYSAWLDVRRQADANLDRKPDVPQTWQVPFYYKDPEGHRKAKHGLQADSNAAYLLALAYRMTDDPKYAEAAVRLLHAWSTGIKKTSAEQDSGLSFSYHFPAFIFAADLLRHTPAWSHADDRAFRRFVRKKALPLNTMSRRNNWGNWGLVLVLASAAYLNDEKLFNSGVARWKELIEIQLAEDGRLTHEVQRGGFGRKGDYGIWYSHFSLFPQTLAAEIARVHGINLFDYQSPTGKSLRLAHEWLIPWVREPQKFPYFQGGDVSQLVGVNYISYYEILNAHWPNPAATELLEKFRPLSALHSAPALTFTHGNLLEDSGP